MQTEIDYAIIGRKIKESRMQEVMTQEKLAELCSLSIQHISNIENGRTKLALPALLKIANVLNISVDYLLDANLTAHESVNEYELLQIFRECDEAEQAVLLDLMRAVRQSLDNHYKK